MSDEGVQRGTHAPVDDRYREPFNQAIRAVCMEFGYAPSNEAVDALKRDLSFIGSDLPRDDMNYWQRRWALDMRAGDYAPPFGARSPTALMLAVMEILHPGDDSAFALGDLVAEVRELKASAE